MDRSRSIFAWTLSLVLAAFFMGSTASGQTKTVLDAQIQETVNQFNLLDDHHAQLMDKAVAALVFPQVTKGGVALASEYGEGALQIHGRTVQYYSVASASFGLTAGMATHREIIFFMTDEALDRFERGRGWSVGADTGFAVIAKGMIDDYRADRLRKPVLVFVFDARGLIADLSVSGSKINRIVK